MDVRKAGPVLALAVLVGCGASRTGRDVAANAATEPETEGVSCPVEVRNDTPYPLVLRQSVPGVRGSIVVGRVPDRGVLRFLARCDVGTVSISGHAGRAVNSPFLAWGSAPLTEGRLTRVELEESRFASKHQGHAGEGGH